MKNWSRWAILCCLSGALASAQEAAKERVTGTGPALVIADSPLWAAPDGDTRLQVQVQFSDPVELLRVDQRGRAQVRTQDGQTGWIATTSLRTARESLTVEDLTGGAQRDPTYVKAVIKNNWRLDEGAARQVPVRAGPGQNQRVIYQLPLSDFEYVFGRRSVGGRNYLLLGRSSSWSPDRARQSMYGWVDAENAIIWNTRVGVYYDRESAGRREPVQIYETAEMRPDQVMAREVTAKTQALKYDTDRFPVVSRVSTDTYRIAFLAGPESSMLMAEIDALRNTDVLFVVDATLSMDRHLPAVLEGVQKYVGALSANERARRRFGLSAYRDYGDGANTWRSVIPLSDYTSFTRAFAPGIRALSGASQNDTDYPEAVFFGITESVRRANWRPGAMKAVVVMGDHGNHPVDRNQLTPAQVFAGLVPRQADPRATAPAVFYAINIDEGSTDAQRRAATTLFQTQMSTVLNFELQQDRKMFGALGVVPARDPAATTNRIVQYLNRLQEFDDQAIRAFPQFFQTGSSGIASSAGTLMEKYFSDLMRRAGIDPAKLKLSQDSLIGEYGFVRSAPMEQWILMSRDDIDNYRAILANLHREGRKANPAKEAILSALTNVTGDRPGDNEAIERYIQRTLGISPPADSVLRYTPAQLAERLNVPSLRRNFLDKVSHMREVLSCVEAGISEKSLTYNEEREEWQVGANPQRQQWYFQNFAGERYAWLPFAFLP